LWQQYKHHQDNVKNLNTPKSGTSKKETEHKHLRRPIKDHKFSLSRKSMLSKQYLQQGYWQTQPIETRPYTFTLIYKTLCTSPVLSLPLADAAGTSHKSPSKFLIASKIRTTNTGPQNLASMKIFGSDFTMDVKDIP
jgi:hypothetical protein